MSKLSDHTLSVASEYDLFQDVEDWIVRHDGEFVTIGHAQGRAVMIEVNPGKVGDPAMAPWYLYPGFREEGWLFPLGEDAGISVFVGESGRVYADFEREGFSARPTHITSFQELVRGRAVIHHWEFEM